MTRATRPNRDTVPPRAVGGVVLPTGPLAPERAGRRGPLRAARAPHPRPHGVPGRRPPARAADRSLAGTAGTTATASYLVI
ncbi:hypothetical protein HNR12_002413 [Streptomonospora nanhaiensis]|uniref:Uncharacterized protein n=1 Tax=Streptomonospora nanhaiensis TaxID=1323731 RepID=A0A853BNE1_9ACTN|nr:hypothetical protein [Streptomonospora nanhaiensis]